MINTLQLIRRLLQLTQCKYVTVLHLHPHSARNNSETLLCIPKCFSLFYQCFCFKLTAEYDQVLNRHKIQLTCISEMLNQQRLQLLLHSSFHVIGLLNANLYCICNMVYISVFQYRALKLYNMSKQTTQKKAVRSERLGWL